VKHDIPHSYKNVTIDLLAHVEVGASWEKEMDSHEGGKEEVGDDPGRPVITECPLRVVS
jgi:hypothetical protein